jgi:hypothetical protein
MSALRKMNFISQLSQVIVLNSGLSIRSLPNLAGGEQGDGSQANLGCSILSFGEQPINH